MKNHPDKNVKERYPLYAEIQTDQDGDDIGADAAQLEEGVQCGLPRARKISPFSMIVEERSPPTASICVVSTMGVQRGPNSQGIKTGAVMAIKARVGKANAVESCKLSR